MCCAGERLESARAGRRCAGVARPKVRASGTRALFRARGLLAPRGRCATSNSRFRLALVFETGSRLVSFGFVTMENVLEMATQCANRLELSQVQIGLVETYRSCESIGGRSRAALKALRPTPGAMATAACRWVSATPGDAQKQRRQRAGIRLRIQGTVFGV